jgi:hypothetical protein
MPDQRSLADGKSLKTETVSRLIKEQPISFISNEMHPKFVL